MKRQVRVNVLRDRNSVPSLVQIEASSKILANLVNSDFWQVASSVMLYLSIGSEVFTLLLLSKAIEQGKKLILPKVKEKHIIPIEVGNVFRLVSGFGGILEPEDDNRYVGTIDLCIVPLVAFDSNGYRIGYGGGYYDKFLSEYRSKIRFKVGLAYELQRYESLPIDEHDVMLDAIFTEKEVIKV